MFIRKRIYPFINKALVISLLLFSFQCAVQAAIVTTPQLLEQQISAQNKQRLVELLQREQVQAQLVELGVNPADAITRVEHLSAAEIQRLNNELETLPAGSGVVGTLAFVFIVLLITDILGYTDIFPFVKKTVN